MKKTGGDKHRQNHDTDIRRKEKENRQLQSQLRAEKDKLNKSIFKYQRELNDMQAVSDQQKYKQKICNWLLIPKNRNASFFMHF